MALVFCERVRYSLLLGFYENVTKYEHFSMEYKVTGAHIYEVFQKAIQKEYKLLEK